jgi:hypothetical protein
MVVVIYAYETGLNKTHGGETMSTNGPSSFT